VEDNSTAGIGLFDSGMGSFEGISFPKDHYVDLQLEGMSMGSNSLIKLRMQVEEGEIKSYSGLSKSSSAAASKGRLERRCVFDSQLDPPCNCTIQYDNSQEYEYYPKGCERLEERLDRYTALGTLRDMKENLWGCFDDERSPQDCMRDRDGVFHGYGNGVWLNQRKDEYRIRKI